MTAFTSSLFPELALPNTAYGPASLLSPFVTPTSTSQKGPPVRSSPLPLAAARGDDKGDVVCKVA